ncbi:MAG: tetratricopeptide repeat protein [Sandaracinaceae bacterium]|nr:tetratricopeptide repeat protein [Sandaracinaceae bacterium]
MLDERAGAGADYTGAEPLEHAMIRVIAIFIALLPAATLAQESADALRQRGRVAVREGRFEDAAELFSRAAEHTDDPSVWLEVGDMADRLRRDDVALHAYQTYLQRRPSSPDRVEIEARVRILVSRVHDRDRLLVDWEGGSVQVQRRPMPLAEWEGDLRESPPRPRELMPMPEVLDLGLGRRLDAP